MSTIKFPLDFKPGLGYSPNSGPPVGGWPMLQGSGFYDQSLKSVLPNFGRSRKKKFSRTFGYPLLNTPSTTLDLKNFPQYPSGPSNIPGGDGGVFLQGMPGFQAYWGYGKKKKKSKKSKKSKKKSYKLKKR